MGTARRARPSMNTTRTGAGRTGAGRTGASAARTRRPHGCRPHGHGRTHVLEVADALD
ncbi:MAG TPA: hypothetical protein IAC28_04250 [Candidatus Aphodovivens excrementavium]|nr:hypothetical protein [Candidatus Aphodovivens excrementavium]